MSFTLHLGDCLDVMRNLPDNSVDSICTDPPYGLSFMSHHWDYAIPGVEIWKECMRVLKPGGHLLSFAGTRTQHRMAVNIEDAGFEIRDMIAWVYGSGFPKSMDVSKAIDKAAGAERELTRPGKVQRDGYGEDWDTGSSDTRPRFDVPATAAAAAWQGWGTALKPSIETITMAIKPCTDIQELDIILSSLIRLEVRLWLLSSASAAEKNSTSNQSEYGAACAIAQWSAEEITNTLGALCDQMGTSPFELATNTSLSIVSSWRRTLAEILNDGNTSTTETKLSTTIDWRTLKFSLSQITPSTIIKACSLPGGFSANASTAESHFNASLLLLQSIRTLSATEPAISQEAENCRGADVKPNLDPCIMARKPLAHKTVAANVLAHGTGAMNIDACRVPLTGDADAATFENNHRVTERLPQEYDGQNLGLHDGGWKQRVGEAVIPPGRWPANLIHDGSEEVLAAFPEAKGQLAKASTSGTQRAGQNVYGQMVRGSNGQAPRIETERSAARFFYCSKATSRDRHEGLAHPGAQFKHGVTLREVEDTETKGNNHPTVKPTDLMRYLCRLITPPGGVVLDPFLGSGSTGKAAMLEGFKFIGIEREAAYMEIARARIAFAAAEDLL